MRIDRVKKASHVYSLFEERKSIFVHRYAWGHSNLRKITRRMCKDGLLVKIGEDKEGFRYARNEHNDNH